MSKDKEKKDKLDSKCLYTCECIVDASEYKKVAKYFPQIYWSYVFRGTILNLIINLIIRLTGSDSFTSTTIFIIIQIYLFIIYKVRLEHFVEKSFYSLLENNILDTELHTDFYDDYFIRYGERTSLKIFYCDIDKSIETDTNFYLRLEKGNRIVIIQRDRCSEELINFLRNKLIKSKKFLEEKEKIKTSNNSIKEDKISSKVKNPKFINTFMAILAILTFLSIYCSFYSFSIFADTNNGQLFSVFKKAWIMWCWLPIPLLSIILGHIFSKKGISCKLNIVIGYTVFFIIGALGMFSLLPSISDDYEYSRIYDYTGYIGVKIPDNGELVIEEYDYYYDDDKTDYTIVRASYSEEDVEELEKEILENDNWIIGSEFKSIFKLLMPKYSIYVDGSTYYSIYNKTIDEYNSMPSDSGEYEMYIMIYHMDKNYLAIHKYNLAYID